VLPITREQLSQLSTSLSSWQRPMTMCSLDESHCIAVAAHSGHVCVGIAAATVNSGCLERSASVRNLEVVPCYRRRGVGTALLRQLEADVQSSGSCKLRFATVGNAIPRALVSLLRRCDWPSLIPAGIFCETDSATLGRARWMKYKKLPESAQVFPWNELTLDEEYDIRSQLRSGALPQTLNPLGGEANINFRVSFGMRKAGRVVGWCVFRTAGTGENLCASLFITRELESRGFSIGLATRAIEAVNQFTPGRIIFDVSFRNPAMIQFLCRGIAAHLRSMQLVRTSEKHLSDLTPPT
jgi:GNAT superfamily N-acetyltransferase